MSDDEVGRVARTFNGMIDNIRRMMGELSQREAVAAMGELAATLAHQLRSPATAMRLDIERALDKLPAQSPERALIARSLTQLERMERAIAGSLRVARSAGAQFGSIDIHEPIGRAIRSMDREHAMRGIRFDCSGLPDGALTVRGDAPALEQLFANVLTNAAQAAGENGRVTISADSARNGLMMITIRDNGPGMSAEVLARAGESFFSTKREGTGLGLAIAKRIASAHGGRLAIESAEGAGTTVRMELPRITS